MRFSERIGAQPPPSSGIEEASERLRTALWNKSYPAALPEAKTKQSEAIENARLIWDHIGWRTDRIPFQIDNKRKALAEHWFSCEWYDFFDLLEFVVSRFAQYKVNSPWHDIFNSVLESQGCAYRFIAGELAPLTNRVEVSEVTLAAESAIPAVATHIRDALRFLPPNPEVSERNSVKESISAVEAALKNFSGDAGATLTQGLKVFEDKYGELHPALRAGLLKLYGYTSDEKGVRHALMDETASVTVDDARFMVVFAQPSRTTWSLCRLPEPGLR
jgi:hypothetical protein